MSVGWLAKGGSRPVGTPTSLLPPRPISAHLLNSSTRYSISCSAMRMALAASVMVWRQEENTGEKDEIGESVCSRESQRRYTNQSCFFSCPPAPPFWVGNWHTRFCFSSPPNLERVPPPRERVPPPSPHRPPPTPQCRRPRPRPTAHPRRRSVARAPRPRCVWGGGWVAEREKGGSMKEHTAAPPSLSTLPPSRPVSRPFHPQKKRDECVTTHGEPCFFV